MCVVSHLSVILNLILVNCLFSVPLQTDKTDRQTRRQADRQSGGQNYKNRKHKQVSAAHGNESVVLLGAPSNP